MPGISHSILWLGAFIALGVVLLLLRGQFSSEARARRRRRKSYRPVASRQHGPTVKLAVDVEKPKRGRKQ